MRLTVICFILRWSLTVGVLTNALAQKTTSKSPADAFQTAVEKLKRDPFIKREAQQAQKQGDQRPQAVISKDLVAFFVADALRNGLNTNPPQDILVQVSQLLKKQIDELLQDKQHFYCSLSYAYLVYGYSLKKLGNKQASHYLALSTKYSIEAEDNKICRRVHPYMFFLPQVLSQSMLADVVLEKAVKENKCPTQMVAGFSNIRRIFRDRLDNILEKVLLSYNFDDLAYRIVSGYLDFERTIDKFSHGKEAPCQAFVNSRFQALPGGSVAPAGYPEWWPKFKLYFPKEFSCHYHYVNGDVTESCGAFSLYYAASNCRRFQIKANFASSLNAQIRFLAEQQKVRLAPGFDLSAAFIRFLIQRLPEDVFAGWDFMNKDENEKFIGKVKVIASALAECVNAGDLQLLNQMEQDFIKQRLRANL